MTRTMRLALAAVLLALGLGLGAYCLVLAIASEEGLLLQAAVIAALAGVALGAMALPRRA